MRFVVYLWALFGLVIVTGCLLGLDHRMCWCAAGPPADARQLTRADVECFGSGAQGGMAVLRPGTFYGATMRQIEQWCGFAPLLLEGGNAQPDGGHAFGTWRSRTGQ